MKERTQRLWILTRSAFFTIVVPGTVLYFVPHFAAAFRYPRQAIWLLVGAICAVPGAGLLLYCIFDFAWTGLGTLAPIDPPRNLVVRGPYQYVRNPMYVGVLAVLAGEAIAFRSAFLPAYAVVVFVCVNLFVRLYEEPALRRKFGESYVRYCASVPRWLPRVHQVIG